MTDLNNFFAPDFSLKHEINCQKRHINPAFYPAYNPHKSDNHSRHQQYKRHYKCKLIKCTQHIPATFILKHRIPIQPITSFSRIQATLLCLFRYPHILVIHSRQTDTRNAVYIGNANVPRAVFYVVSGAFRTARA